MPIILATTTDALQLVTVGTQVLKTHASFFDQPGTVVGVGRLNLSISSATTTSLAGSPTSSGIARSIKYLSIYNSDTTTPAAITLQHFITGNLVLLRNMVLLPGMLALWTEARGFKPEPSW